MVVITISLPLNIFQDITWFRLRNKLLEKFWLVPIDWLIMILDVGVAYLRSQIFEFVLSSYELFYIEILRCFLWVHLVCIWFVIDKVYFHKVFVIFEVLVEVFALLGNSSDRFEGIL